MPVSEIPHFASALKCNTRDRTRSLGVCGPLRDADACTHPLADARISAVDVRDVGACAAALLAAETPPAPTADGSSARYYDVTGPAAIRLSDELAAAISALRPTAVTIEHVGVDEWLVARALPPALSANLGGFFRVLATECADVTDVVEELTGRPARDVRAFVTEHADAFV